MKRIIVCSDGTWDSPEKDHPTNILRLARGIQPVGADGNEQVVFYDWGVGSDRKKIAGGITGVGIDKNIQDCYRFLIHNYDPGDEIYLFGFSRGAYTVRSLGGLIRNSGLLRRDRAHRVYDAYDLYRRRGRTSHPNSPKAVGFRNGNAVDNKTQIHFMGVFDTVGARGVPVPFFGSVGEEKYLFHDLQPSSIVSHARHAISIDENRVDFDVSLWEFEKEADREPSLDLEQVWFPGVHKDVGGGYPESGLSDHAFRWVVTEAVDAGLTVEGHLTASIKPNARDKQHNQYKGFYKVRKKYARTIRAFAKDMPVAKAKVHTSVKERWDRVPAYRRSKPLKRFLDQVGAWDNVNLVT